MDTLSAELVDAIIHKISFDRPTLIACSLVCKQWLWTSRHHLFSAIDVSAANVGILKTLIQSSACTLRPAIQMLSFHVSENDSWVRIFCTNFAPFLSITSLAVFLYGADMSQPTLSILPTAFPHVKHFDVFSTTPSRTLFRKQVATVCTFNSLQTIVLHGDHFGSSPIDVSLRIPSHVQSLKLDLSPSALIIFVRWLLLHSPMPSIATLHVFNVNDECFRTVSQFMRACSKTLTDLSLGLQRPYLARFTVELGPTIPLLRRFCYCTNTMDAVLNMANMISAMCPAPLEQLTLRVPIECMRQKGWVELQASLNAVKASEIIMVVDDHPNYEVALRKKLSHSNLSGTLFVISHTSSGIAFGYSEETFALFKRFIRRDHGRSVSKHI
ncbi:hypothetical protein BDZ89DRAFT_1127377 [Hymenopellis radicata]|nr:hypothetical protein BDZ89DRAFT_1127377 [Hymenopellis radicata]